jgi:hypothetical protein
MKELWAIFIPGPDEYHAAPSEAVAKHMAEKHNSAMQEWLLGRDDKHGLAPMTVAQVAEWPFEPEAHAKEVKDFDYAAWALEGGAA